MCPGDVFIPDSTDCTDDLTACSDDTCMSGVCTHPDNNTCGACTLSDGSCVDGTRPPGDGTSQDCTGVWVGPGTACLGMRACCNDPLLPDFAPFGCRVVDMSFCTFAGGSIHPAGFSCQGDSNLNGNDDLCDGLAFAPCELIKLTASDSAEFDFFGFSVEIDDD